ncbi:DUF1642 domain-containing protein [Streptococcus uberis]|uniref:DUF1642 domain-containing protein n=1 Tax=Streptococcus uberis TaxID=1349 RepID=UPI001FF60E3F|nr:DUF1642 domain-containing protein [Streptococcus uberis]MCK1213211.1 DUF1642 domain-containing protein [Streptococcus uberis]
MNIEEKEKLKEEIKKVAYNSGTFFNIYEVSLGKVLKIIDKFELDQPKLVVSQMIFDVIESFDEDVEYLHEHLNHQSDEVREWLTHNERDFYEAWLAYPNITVEKEKLYTVEIPNPNNRVEHRHMMLVKTSDGRITLTELIDSHVNLREDVKLTEAEIRKDFGWAWQWKKEVV